MAIHAPPFPLSLTWFNTLSPLTVAELCGRPTLLEFFTPGCLNCIHALEESLLLEKRFGHQGFLCVRILAPKFPHERSPACAQDFIARHNITGPLALDADRVAWDAYAIKAWPSFVLLNENGNVAFATSGEGRGAVLAQEIDAILKRTSRTPAYVSDIRRKQQFHYPTRVCAGTVGGESRLFVSDAGNHRIVCLDADGRYLTRYGEDELHSPQGMALDAAGETLYVCDAGHHRIVAIDLTGAGAGAGAASCASDLREVAGTGKSGFFPVGASGHALELPLGSPWAIAPWNGVYVVALAGAHQLVVWDPVGSRVAHLAGTGIENLVDGAAHECALAQPSGVCVGGDGFVYFVDAESSSLRRLQPGKSGVETLVGEGLFSFGKEDGPLEQAQFQHCADIAWSDRNSGVWVCDSYNNALRFVSPQRGQVSTLPLPIELSEPSGVFLSSGVLHVVDTNAHRVVSFQEPVFPWAADHPVPLEALKLRTGPFGVLADFVLRTGGSRLA